MSVFVVDVSVVVTLFDAQDDIEQKKDTLIADVEIAAAAAHVTPGDLRRPMEGTLEYVPTTFPQPTRADDQQTAINLEDLLRQRTVERDRIEYKAGWNPDPTIRTLCAFANDFENLGGGYIIIGQDCDDDGQPIFPPAGIPDSKLDKIQRELLAYCNQIQPSYFPSSASRRWRARV